MFIIVHSILNINIKMNTFNLKCVWLCAGKGADVILDCVGGSFWEKNICSLAVDGRWVLYGMLGGKTADGDLLGKLLRKRGNLLCSLLRSRSLQVRLRNRFSFCSIKSYALSMYDCVLFPV